MRAFFHLFIYLFNYPIFQSIYLQVEHLIVRRTRPMGLRSFMSRWAMWAIYRAHTKSQQRAADKCRRGTFNRKRVESVFLVCVCACNTMSRLGEVVSRLGEVALQVSHNRVSVG